MDKILIVSNVNCDELGKFIEQRRTFEIAGCYSSLSDNLVDIQNKIIDVQKTLYLYQPEEGPTNIRADMQVLQNLLMTNGFFRPGEIIFMTRTSQQCKQAEKYFMTVMTACKKEDYVIKGEEGTISFSLVYDNLLGISTSDSFKNTYKTIYRVERDSESTVSYEKKDSSKLSIEPFSFDSLENYEKQKKIVEEMSSLSIFREDVVEPIKKLENPHFGQVEYVNTLGDSKTILMTGKPKSGLSTWVTTLAISSHKAGKSVMVLDFTANGDVQHHLVSEGITFTDCKMKTILQLKDSKEGLNVCTYSNVNEYAMRLNFLIHVFSNKLLRYDVVIVGVDYRDFESVCEVLKSNVSKVLLTVTPRYSDVLELLDWSDAVKGMPVITIMNNCVRYKDDDTMSQQQVKDTLGILDSAVVKECWFEKLDVSAALYNAIVA